MMMCTHAISDWIIRIGNPWVPHFGFADDNTRSTDRRTHFAMFRVENDIFFCVEFLLARCVWLITRNPEVRYTGVLWSAVTQWMNNNEVKFDLPIGCTVMQWMTAVHS